MTESLLGVFVFCRDFALYDAAYCLFIVYIIIPSTESIQTMMNINHKQLF